MPHRTVCTNFIALLRNEKWKKNVIITEYFVVMSPCRYYLFKIINVKYVDVLISLSDKNIMLQSENVSKNPGLFNLVV